MSSPSFLRCLLILVFLLSLNNIHLCFGSDSITPTQPLSATQTIISEGDIFELGFFAPSNSSPNFYIGIWYKQVPERTVVWVANREIPLPRTNNFVLKISEDGNLHLLSPSNVSIWSTNVTTSASPCNSTVAVLLDSGNFVLRNGTNPSLIYWQSFDHPTDTFLPDSLLGLNKVTGENKRLTSWKSKENPAPGPFSYEIDPNQSQYFLLWNETESYWSTGLWDGKVFRGIPAMDSSSRSNYSFVNNETGKYFSYTLRDPSTFAHSVLSVSGVFMSIAWVKETNKWSLYWFEPRNQCDVYAVCGIFGSCNERNPSFCTCLPGFIPIVQKDWDLGSWSDGCRRKTPLQISEKSTSDVERDRFWALPAMKIPAESQSLYVASAEECKMACLTKRSCSA